MSLHSYSRVWLHLVWGTLERRPLLPKPAAAKVSGYLSRIEELRRLVERYGLTWREEETAKAVPITSDAVPPR